MVANITILKILRFLEKYLIAKANYHLGVNYDLVLLIPEQSTYRAKYSWVISAKILDKIPQKDFITEVLTQLREVLPQEEYLSIARINKLDSQDSLVQNINFLYPFNEEMTEINNFQTGGGASIERGILLRSKILSKIREGSAVTITLTTEATINRTFKTNRINAGIISINSNFVIKHWTGKGLRELFAPDRSPEEIAVGEEIKTREEEYLINHQYISFINLDDIEDVY